MGLMNRLRDKTHIILIVLIIAFLATIVFEWGMDYLGLSGGQVTQLGIVNGQEINIQEFENQVQQTIEQQKQQTGEDPDEALIQMIRDQVWDNMVTQILVQQEIEKLGFRVTNEEILNWVYNSPQTLPDIIRQNFIDSTGQFNMGVYQQALASKEPEVAQFWSQVEAYLKQILLNQKLQSVITGIVRVSESDVMQKYKDENLFAAFDFVHLTPQMVLDNQIQVMEEDLKNFYEKHKDEFKSEESVKLKYVMFSDNPTIEDSAVTAKNLKALTKELKKYPANDTNLKDLVNSNSVNKFNDTVWLKPNELAQEVANFLFSASKDSVSDVIIASDGYHLVRLLDSKEGDQTFVNANHILINFGTDTNAAKLKADQIYNRAKSGEDFTKLAAENSDDASNKFNSGNLGWFTKGAMVKEFEDAAMNSAPGSIVGPVKTQFGYHIIKVIDRQKKVFKAADIKMLVKTSTKTKDAVRKRAEDFAYVSQKESFDEQAVKLNLKIQETPPITKTSFIPGAGQNQSVIRFAFNEGVNSISDPIKVQGGYAVYLITDKIPAGTTSFEEIKETVIRPRVINEKKLDILKQTATELRANLTGNDLNNIKLMDQNINVQSVDSFAVARPNPQLGSDFTLINAIYKLSNGQISEPIRTDNGYFIVQMKSITPFEQEKYNAQADIIRTQLLAQRKQSIVQEWLAELKENADIVDNRDKFFR